MDKRRTNALQTILFIAISIPVAREWKKAYDRGGTNRTTAAALLISQGFLMIAAFTRLQQRLLDPTEPPKESITVWNFVLLHAVIHYALSKGWFL